MNALDNILGNAANFVPTNTPSADPLSMQSILGNTKIQVRRLLMIDDVGYRNQAQRPFQINYNGDAKEVLRQSLSNVSNSITPQIVAQVANAYVTPTADSTSVNIIGGWNTSRLRFMMYVRATVRHTHKDYLLTGYTDSYGIQMSLGGNNVSVNPQMRFFIDKTISLNNELALPNLGISMLTDSTYKAPSIEYNAGILCNPNATSDGFGKPTYLLQPGNVFAAIDSQGIQQSPIYEAQGVLDSRLTLKANAESFDIGNTHAPNFLSNIINSYRSGQFAAASASNASAGNVVSNNDIYSAIFRQQEFSDFSISKNPLVTAISNMRGIPGSFSNDFSYEELCRLDPNTIRDDVSLFARRSETARDYQALSFAINPMDTQDWQRASRINQVAAAVNNSITTIMMDYGIVGMGLVAANGLSGDVNINPMRGFVGSFTCLLTNCDTLGGPLPQQFRDYVQQRLEREVFMPLSYNNQVKFTLSGDFNLAGRSAFQMAYDNEPVTPYVVPSFCGSIISPLYTNNVGIVDNLSSGVSAIIRDSVFDISGNISGMSSIDGGI